MINDADDDADDDDADDDDADDDDADDADDDDAGEMMSKLIDVLLVLLIWSVVVIQLEFSLQLRWTQI